MNRFFGSKSLDRFGYVMETKTLVFFRNHTKATGKVNRIEGLNIGSKRWCFDDERLKQHAIKVFKNLYIVDPCHAGAFNCYGWFSLLTIKDRDYLAKEVLREEIHNAVFRMVLPKAPGIDGFHAKFYWSQWDTVCGLIQAIFKGNYLDPSINRTLLVLIPKMQGTLSLSLNSAQSVFVQFCTR